MRGQPPAVRGGEGLRWADGRACDKAQPQQRRAEGQQAPKQGQFHLVGGVYVGLGAGDIGQQILAIVLYLVYSLLCVGSHWGLLRRCGG